MSQSLPSFSGPSFGRPVIDKEGYAPNEQVKLL